jgi:hypothetical protein
VRFEASKDTGKDEDAGRTLVEAMSDLASLQLGEEEADKRLAALIEEHTRGALTKITLLDCNVYHKKGPHH